MDTSKMYNRFLNIRKEQEPFSKELVDLRVKDYDKLIEYIDSGLMAINNIPGVEYLGASIDTNENNIPLILKDKRKVMSINEERKIIVNIKYRFTVNGETEEVTKQIYFPKLLDNFYFIINGNKFYPMLQIVDDNTYKTGRIDSPKITLKTMIMPLRVSRKKIQVKDHLENKYNGYDYLFEAFKSTISYIKYVFATYEFNDALAYINCKDKVELIKIDKDTEYDDDNYIYFNYNTSNSVKVDKSLMLNPEYFNGILILVSLLNNKLNNEKILDKNYWVKKIGEEFTKNLNNKQSKGEQIVGPSLDRLLDEFTKNNLKRIANNINSTLDVVLFMVDNFEQLSKKSNMDLAHKRLRFCEYLIYPLILKNSKVSYRLFNATGELEMKHLKQLVAYSPNIIMDSIKTSDLVRYDNAVNGFDLFQSALKMSIKGPQSISGNGNLGVAAKDIHPSYIGNVSLTYSSASSVGETLMLTPFAKLHGLHFIPPINKDITDK